MSGGAALAGRVAVVTGGTDGIGAAAARILRAQGADVVIVGRSREKADRLVADDERSGAPGTLTALVADLGLMRTVVDTVSQLSERVGRVDLLLHAVGVLIPRREHTARASRRTSR